MGPDSLSYVNPYNPQYVGMGSLCTNPNFPQPTQPTPVYVPRADVSASSSSSSSTRSEAKKADDSYEEILKKAEADKKKIEQAAELNKVRSEKVYTEPTIS